MLMRRAPREVYRVYDAEEFLADVGVDAPVDEAPQFAGDRRLHQIVGAMMLVAVLGALGALLAIIGLSSIGSGRRVRSSSLATAGSTTASRVARVHLQRGALPSRQVRIWPPRERDSARKPRRPGSGGRARKFAADPLRWSGQGVPARAAEVANVVARPSAPHPQPAEFGFER
jgi:hypothetical protein